MRVKARLLLLIAVVGGSSWIGPTQCLAEWTKTIECPAGRVYRDVRNEAGRHEFCELLLPGSLKVQDGPSRWWDAEDRLGGEGSYQNGRQIGRWKECDRFGRCHDQVYELISSAERARGGKPEVPVSYAGGKYAFDFGSCWSTWVKRETSGSALELNIISGLVRCQISYLPEIDEDRPDGGQRVYSCEIPYSVGVRQFDSLDLRKELPKAGLPQFCRHDKLDLTELTPEGDGAQAFAIWVNQPFADASTGKQVRAWTTVANLVDVECAAITFQPGAERLTVRLNKYAEKLVLDRVGKDELKADTCGGQLPLTPIDVAHDASGRSLFTYGFSKDHVTAERQRRCITTRFTLHPSCASQ